jgi:hypothetical protein
MSAAATAAHCEYVCQASGVLWHGGVARLLDQARHTCSDGHWHMLRQVLALPQGRDAICAARSLLQADSGVRTLWMMPWPPGLIPAQSERWQGRHCCYCWLLAMSKAATLTTRALAEQTWWTSTQTLKRKAEVCAGVDDLLAAPEPADGEVRRRASRPPW